MVKPNVNYTDDKVTEESWESKITVETQHLNDQVE
jgi:hypothetical protein